MASSVSANGLQFRLAKDCPAYFRMTEAKRCVLDLPTTYFDKSIEAINHPLRRHTTESWKPEEFSLGRFLFFDPILSKDKNMSCGSCHQPAKGMSDGLDRSIGHQQLPLSRSAPALINLAFKTSFNWDGAVQTLREHITRPLFSNDEMRMSPSLIERRLNDNLEYSKLFRQVYGTSRITFAFVERALVAFEISLISFASRYDRFVAGDTSAFNTSELQGYNVFRSFLTRCSECHIPPLFTNQQKAITGVKYVFPNSDISSPDHILVPTLRNIALTAPYMHAGQISDLKGVVEFYDQGGGREQSPPGLPIHWHIRPIGLSEEEKQSLVNFLHTLTDVAALPKVPAKAPSGITLLRPTQQN